jgi:FkbM family methyltransferase
MRLRGFADYFALRRHLLRPRDLLRVRKKALAEPFQDLALRGGGVARIRSGSLDRHIFHRIFARDEYRLGTIPLDSLEVVIDVGAHVGLFALRAAPLARRLLAYEPAPANFELLRKNVERLARVEPRAALVAGSAGRARLYLSSDPAAHSLFPPLAGETAPALEVEATTIEAIFAQEEIERCDLLKLDCEGAEYQVLRAVPAGLWPRIERIALEYHPAPAGESWSGEKLTRFLEEMGLRVSIRPSRKEAGRGLLFARRR